MSPVSDAPSLPSRNRRTTKAKTDATKKSGATKKPSAAKKSTVTATLAGAGKQSLRGNTIRNVWVALDAGEQPPRNIDELRLARDGVRIFALERSKRGARISVWSAETGAHLEDLTFGTGKIRILDFFESSEGTLRCLTLSEDSYRDARLWERAPGRGRFVERYAAPLDAHTPRSPDLLFFLEVAGAYDEDIRVRLHDVEAKKQTPLNWPHALGDNPSGTFARGRFIVADTTESDDEDNDGRLSKLVLIDPTTATFEELPMAQRIHGVVPSGGDGTVLLQSDPSPDDEAAYPEDTYLEFNVANRTVSGQVPNPFTNARLVGMGALLWDPDNGVLRNKAGEEVGSFSVRPRKRDYDGVCGCYVPTLDRLVVAWWGANSPLMVGARSLG